jgi:PAS domain-containing protein
MPILNRFGAYSARDNQSALSAEGEILDGSDLQIWTGEKIAKFCRSPFLLARLTSWKEYAVDGVPKLSEMYSSQEEADLEDAMLLLNNGNDFVFVFQGSESVRKYGRTFRGATLSKIQGSLKAKMKDLYSVCIRENEPSYCHYNADYSAEHVCWERLSLPLSLDGSDGVRFVLTYSFPLDHKLEILSAVFERSPIGMIAAAAELGDKKPLSTARITLINSRAREILKLNASEVAIRTVAQLRQWIKDVVGWTQLSESENETTKRQTIRYEDKNNGRKFMIMIEPISRFVVFHVLESEN